MPYPEKPCTVRWAWGSGLFHKAYKPTSLQEPGEQCKADRGPIRARPPETAHDRPTAGYVGNLVATRAASSSTGIFASPCAISGKMLYERGPAPQKLRLRCGPLHPCVQCCPDILCRDLSTMPCGSLPARPPGACIPLQLGLSAYLLWWQCMLAVPGCMCCLLCMPASQCTLSLLVTRPSGDRSLLVTRCSHTNAWLHQVSRRSRACDPTPKTDLSSHQKRPARPPLTPPPCLSAVSASP